MSHRSRALRFPVRWQRSDWSFSSAPWCASPGQRSVKKSSTWAIPSPPAQQTKAILTQPSKVPRNKNPNFQKQKITEKKQLCTYRRNLRPHRTQTVPGYVIYFLFNFSFFLNRWKKNRKIDEISLYKTPRSHFWWKVSMRIEKSLNNNRELSIKKLLSFFR